MDSSTKPPNSPLQHGSGPDKDSSPAPLPQKRSISNDESEQRGGTRNAPDDKPKNLGRKAFSRAPPKIDRKPRREGEEPPSKRRKAEDGERPVPIYATQFSREEIESDQRKPKRKVAVLMSYSGTGYHGMQLTDDHKTIEGELFAAFVAAGAISKVNAMDPKKSSLVRCARTDKGVHAGGNIISLKLIIEDPDLLKKINDNLSSQIRVWEVLRTTNGFSSHHGCDSRIYEYLIPTHCFIPPHPSTFIARKLREAAIEKGQLDEYNNRQADMANYWEEIDNQFIKPIIERLHPKARKEVLDALCISDDTMKVETSDVEAEATSTEQQEGLLFESSAAAEAAPDRTTSGRLTVNEAIKQIRATYFKAKKTFRIHPDRVARVNQVLSLYVGTRNFHNYTIQKEFKDPSARRVIRSFAVSGEPKLINGTEWLSLKVHGQSFMMHQIRKMVAMVALIVRSGSPADLITQSYGPEKIPIPKAPGLGLLLERPIFENYNKKAAQFEKDPIDFGKFEKDIDEFKQREIYQRIFTEEEESDTFGNFFNHIDTVEQDTFLYVTANGIPPPATEKSGAAEDRKKADASALAQVEAESDSDVPNNAEEEG